MWLWRAICSPAGPWIDIAVIVNQANLENRIRLTLQMTVVVVSAASLSAFQPSPEHLNLVSYLSFLFVDDHPCSSHTEPALKA